MQRRTFSREFKLEAVNLIRDWGVSYAHAARDLDANVNMLRRWVKLIQEWADKCEGFRARA